MEREDLKSYEGFPVALMCGGKLMTARLETRLYEHAVLSFPKTGEFARLETYELMDEDIKTFAFLDGTGQLIGSQIDLP